VPPDLDAFVAAVGEIPTVRDPGIVRQRSRDFHWFSPILREALGGKFAEVVVAPRTEAEVVRIAAAAAKYRVPLTARGAGTGTFGQAVPLAGGAIVDMTALGRMIWLRDRAFRAEGGLRLAALDEHARKLGWELRMHPSTKRTSTLAGFVAGGHAGIGTLNYGILRDRGNILGLKVVTIEERPNLLEIRGNDVQTVRHAYGVNGLITEVEMPLAPAYRWLDVVVGFDDFMMASAFAFALTMSDGILKKLCSVFAWPIPRYFKPLAPFLPDGKHAVLAMAAAETKEAFDALVREFGGVVSFCEPEGAGPMQVPLYEYTWGHTTLHGLRVDKAITYLVCIFPREDTLGSIERIHKQLGAVAPLHLEMKRFDGYVTAEGIPLVRFESREQMAGLYRAFEAEGARIADVHTHLLQNGGMKRIDDAQIAFKRAADPHGLMNPGKIAGYRDVAGESAGKGAGLPASGWAY